ncbi:MAG: hypothetical protein KAS99_01305 [Candidatus Omnitrophica bacterium]|nr:hypothetical protein [Candidatus Omnitrophota bacterium]
MSRKGIIILFLALSVLLFAEKIFMGPYALIRVSDTFDSEFGTFKALGEQLSEYGAQLWFPDYSGGRSSHTYHFGPFYLLSIAAKFIPLWLIYCSLLISFTFMAGYGMYRLLKDFFGLSEKLALIGGIVYLFSSLTQPFHLVHEIFNYVFPLFFMWSVVDKHKKWSSSLGRILGLVFIAGISYPVLTLPHFCIIQFLMIILLKGKETPSKKNMLIRWAFVWAGYILIFLPQFYALFSYKHMSHRFYSPNTQSFFFYFREFLSEVSVKSLLVFFLGGSLALIFRSSKIRRIGFLCIMPVALAAFCHSSLYNFFHKTFIAHLEFAHFIFATNFLFTILGFLTIQLVVADKKLQKRFFILGAVAFLWLIRHFAWALYNNLLWLNFFIAIGIVFYCFRTNLTKYVPCLSRIKRGFVLLFCLILVLILIRINRYSYGQENIPYISLFGRNKEIRQLTQRVTPGRSVTLGFHPAIALTCGLETADASGPIQYHWYKTYWGLIVAKQFKTEKEKEHFTNYFYALSLLNGSVLKQFNESPLLMTDSLKINRPLLLSANVTHIISFKPVKELEDFSRRVTAVNSKNMQETALVVGPINRFISAIPRWVYKLASSSEPMYKDNYFSPIPLWIYELDDTFERGYLVDEAVFLPSDEEILEVLKEQSIKDLREKVFICSSDEKVNHTLGVNNKESKNKSVVLRYYSPDKLIFDIETEKPCFLVVSNNYHWNWHADINGEATPIYKANHTFQAVRIDSPGRKKIIFEYKDSFIWKLYLAIPVGILFFAFAVCVRSRSEIVEYENNK